MKTIISYLSILLLLVSCGNYNSNTNSNPTAEEIERQADEVSYTIEIKRLNGKEGWNQDVTANLFKSLSEPSVNSLYDQFINEQNLRELGCSNFNSLSIYEKKLFFIVFFAAITERESDFNPQNVTGKNIGLVQIDYNSAHRHAGEEASNIKSSYDLMDPNENLRIGTHILKNQLNGRWIPEVKGKLLTGRNYYWEVLNDNFKPRIIKSFFNNRFNLPFCQY